MFRERNKRPSTAGGLPAEERSGYMELYAVPRVSFTLDSSRYCRYIYNINTWISVLNGTNPRIGPMSGSTAFPLNWRGPCSTIRMVGSCQIRITPKRKNAF